MRPVRTRQSLLTLAAVTASLAFPAGAIAQSAGDEQYTDPFGQEEAPAQQEPAAEQPAEQPAEEPAAPPADTAEPAPGGDGSTESAPA
jgi:hypothetical protein